MLRGARPAHGGRQTPTLRGTAPPPPVSSDRPLARVCVACRSASRRPPKEAPLASPILALVALSSLGLAADDPFQDALDAELRRVGTELSTASEKPHWIAIGAIDRRELNLLATHGALAAPPDWARVRYGDIDVRVGTPELDNTHKLRDAGWYDSETRFPLDLPLADEDPRVTRLAVWRSAEETYREAARRLIRVRANTDVPLVTAIDDPATDVFVVEASSFRLARAVRFRPAVSTWLNFAPDHLDVHRDLASYEAAKAHLFELGVSGVLVANADDPVVMRNVPAEATVVTFGTDGDWRVDGDDLVGPDGPFMAVADLWRSLPHDIANTLAVAASVAPLGVAPAAVAEAASAFVPLAHRVSPVGTVDGQPYYDDSKATTPHATLSALRGFDRVVLIAGGRNKGIDLSVMATGREHLEAVVAIGESADDIEQAFAGSVPVVRADDMDAAVAAARTLSAGRVPVLLSPGCASFDWYRSYGERGDDFAGRSAS